MVLLVMGNCGVLEDNDNRFWRRADRSSGYQAYRPWLGGKTTAGVATPAGRESKSHKAHPLAYRYYFGGTYRSFCAGEFWRQLGFRYGVSSPAGCYS